MRIAAETDLIDGKYSVEDLLDLGKMRGIFETFARATGFTLEFLDHPGLNPLITAGRRAICAKPRGCCSVPGENCLKKNRRFLYRLGKAGTTVIETCGNGLADCAAPVIVKGRRIASLSAGRILLREPDIGYYKKRSAAYGFNEKEYFDALKEVPVLTEGKIRDLTSCLGELISLLSAQAYDRLELRAKNERVEKLLGEKENAENALRSSEEKYKALFKNSTAGIFIADVETEKILDVNKSAERLAGRTRAELIGMDRAELHPPDQAEFYRQHFRRHVCENGADTSDAFVQRKDGTRIPVQISATVMEIGGRKVMQGLFEDIGERKRIEHELRLSEQKFKDLTETIPDLIWETDENGIYTYVSPKIKELLGYEMREVIGESALRFFSGDDDASEAELRSCLLQKVPFRNIEHPGRHKDGRILAMEASGNPFSDEAGRYKGHRGLTRDITIRKRLEDENTLKAMLLDSVKDAVFLHDPEGRIVYCNEAAYLQCGYTEQEMSNMMFQRLLTPESLKKFAGDTRDAIRSESAVFESEHLRKDGCIIPVETHVHGLELDGEKFILRVVRDVTERKQAERALKESEEKFRVIFENAPIGIYLTDTEDRILAVNDALCAVTGYARDEILNRNSAGFTHPDDLAFSSEWLRKIVAEEQAPRSIETRYLGSDGRVIHAEVSASLIRRAHGPLMHVVVALRDITGRKKAELAREKLMKDLTSTNSEIAQFNSLIAHDLQEPLRMVRSYSELLEKNCAGRLNASGEEFLGYVLSGGKLMQKMLEDLLRYSREGAKAGTPQEVDMNRIMDHVLLLLKSSIDDNKAVISCGRLPVVTADRAQMTHLMLNLVGNAVKFKGADVPRVSVSGVAAKDSYVFTVRDNGIGIAPQFFDRVFKMFQRLHSREEYPGTGMGLALCRKIVENHGGRIWVESLPGKGADFSFTIPRPDKDPVADEEKRN